MSAKIQERHHIEGRNAQMIGQHLMEVHVLISLWKMFNSWYINILNQNFPKMIARQFKKQSIPRYFKNKFADIMFLALCCLLQGCQSKPAATESLWQNLFNDKDLSGWDTYLGPTYDTIQNKQDTLNIPGINNDTKKVFSVVKVDNAPALRISGSHNGGISTVQEFENYHLKLEFKWGYLKWHPRKERKRDSGLLYHAVGAHGADYGFWMRSQELQIQEGDCGDYWGVAGGIMDIPAKGDAPEKYVYDPASPLLDFSANSGHGRRCIKTPDAEKPTGEWNTIEIYCHGDTAVHVVNGVVNMILYNSRQLDKGKEISLSKGKIQLQSEGAEVFYRNIQVQAITKIPDAILN